MFLRILTFIALTSLLVESIKQKRHVTSQYSFENQQCSEQNEIDLVESNYYKSDVIVTGTIVKLVPEVHVGSSRDLVHENITITAHVKPWRVMKGSLEGVLSAKLESKKLRRQTRGGRKKEKKVVIRSLEGASKQVKFLTRENVKLARTTQGGGKVLKLHGLWNSKLCGTFLKEGDTRLFFLRKMEDYRGLLRHDMTLSVGDKWKRLKRKRRQLSPSSILLLSNEPAFVSMRVLDHVTDLAKRQMNTS